MSIAGEFLIAALLARLFGGVPLCAAEFEVLDKFSVDGYSVLRGSADITGGSFAVGISTFAVKDGKIGIGTAAPATILDIRGTEAEILSTNPNWAKGSIFIHDTGIFDAGTAPTIVFSKERDASHNTTQVAAISGQGTYPSTRLDFFTGSGYSLNAAPRMTINASGNVGIGTTNPAALLDVNGALNTTGHFTGTTGAYSSYLTMGSLVVADPGAAYYGFGSRLGGTFATSGGVSIGAAAAAAPANGLIVGGSVGIGTASPLYNLTVANTSALQTTVSKGYGGGFVYARDLLLHIETAGDVAQGDTYAHWARLYYPGNFAGKNGGIFKITIAYLPGHNAGAVACEYQVMQYIDGGGTSAYTNHNYGNFLVQRNWCMTASFGYFTTPASITGNIKFYTHRPNDGTFSNHGGLVIKLPNSGTSRLVDIAIKAEAMGKNTLEEIVKLTDLGEGPAAQPTGLSEITVTILH